LGFFGVGLARVEIRPRLRLRLRLRARVKARAAGTLSHYAQHRQLASVHLEEECRHGELVAP
jgi:hypothetical protein